MGYRDNVELLNGILAVLENGELTTEEETGALDLAAQLNAFTEYGYYIFSPDAVKNVQNHVDAALDQQLPLLKDAINNEAAAMQGVVKLLEA